MSSKKLAQQGTVEQNNGDQKKQASVRGVKLVGLCFMEKGEPLHAGLPPTAYGSVPSNFKSQAIRSH